MGLLQYSLIWLNFTKLQNKYASYIYFFRIHKSNNWNISLPRNKLLITISNVMWLTTSSVPFTYRAAKFSVPWASNLWKPSNCNKNFNYNFHYGYSLPIVYLSFIWAAWIKLQSCRLMFQHNKTAI